jgi:vacuolar-type H+-ATPase subunit F/Vma7
MRAIFLGDEASAAAYRLAGVEARTAPPGEEAASLSAARGSAVLVLVAASVAARLPAPLLRAACAGVAPLVVVVPDLGGDGRLPDLSARLRRQLGLVEERDAARGGRASG